MTAPNGVISDYEYDLHNRLDTLTHFLDDGIFNGTYDAGSDTLIASFDYTVRDDGKRTAVIETFGAGPTNTIAWEYDDLGRLISEHFNSSDNTLDFYHEYDHDLTGNRDEWRKYDVPQGTLQETVTYDYDVNDRLLTETSSLGTTTTYFYDVTQQTGEEVRDTTTSELQSKRIMEYDLQGRMSAVVIEQYSGGTLQSRTRQEYDYDHRGLRVETVNRTDTNLDGTFDQIDSTTTYLVERANHTGYQQVIIEITKDGSGTETKRVTTTFGHDEISQTTVDNSGTETRFFTHDGHGSVRVLLDALGALAVVASADQLFHFDAYGNPHSFTLVQPATSLLYSGEQTDQFTGLQNLRRRPYDPRVGRFFGLDPILPNNRDPQSLHKYLYVHSDPVNSIDPTGLFSLGSSLTATSIGGNLRGLSNSAIVATGARIVLQLAWSSALAWSVLKIQELQQQIVHLDRQKVRADFDYALLADAAYEGPPPVVPGWQHVRAFEYRDTGFHARLFERNGERVIAYAGTREPFLGDWRANIQQGLFGDAQQYQQAIDLVPIVENQFGPVDRFVGHSLGGGLASAAALLYSKPATTFNAAGVNSSFVALYGETLAQANRLIDAYRVRGEILSSVQNVSQEWAAFPHPVVAAMGVIGSVAPNGIGTTYWLPGESFSPIERHLMPEVLDGMRKMM